MILSQRIKHLRWQHDIKLVELAKRSEIGKATLSRIESNQTLGTVDSIVKIARAFQMSVQQFLEGVEFQEVN